jgi:DNA-binding MarR family transcriptional regulator
MAAPGERREQVLAAVTKQPGITVRGIGTQLGVDPTSLYRSVRALENEGLIVKRDAELHPK